MMATRKSLIIYDIDRVYCCNTKDAQKVLKLTYLDKNQTNEHTCIFQHTVFVHGHLVTITDFYQY